jgi:hypothetical protein
MISWPRPAPSDSYGTIKLEHPCHRIAMLPLATAMALATHHVAAVAAAPSCGQCLSDNPTSANGSRVHIVPVAEPSRCACSSVWTTRR